MKINQERVRKNKGVPLLGEVRLLENLRYLLKCSGSGSPRLLQKSRSLFCSSEMERHHSLDLKQNRIIMIFDNTTDTS